MDGWGLRPDGCTFFPSFLSSFLSAPYRALPGGGSSSRRNTYHVDGGLDFQPPLPSFLSEKIAVRYSAKDGASVGFAAKAVAVEMRPCTPSPLPFLLFFFFLNFNQLGLGSNTTLLTAEDGGSLSFPSPFFSLSSLWLN